MIIIDNPYLCFVSHHKDLEFHLEETLTKYIRPGCSAAFARDLGGEETVAYVAELRETTADKQLLSDLADTVRRTVADSFQVGFIYTVITTSGWYRSLSITHTVIVNLLDAIHLQRKERLPLS